jgi:ABC-type sugar transport system permease subunit
MYASKFKGRWIPWLFLLLTLVILTVFLFDPVIQTFRLSTYRVALLGL